jgi:hypothetical protein
MFAKNIYLSNKVVYFCLFLYLTAIVRPIVPLVNYTINQDYISEFLCINKNKPELNCNGKCFLAKEIQKQNETEKNKPTKASKENYLIGILNTTNSSIKKFELYILCENIHQSKTYLYKSIYNFFHPPI